MLTTLLLLLMISSKFLERIYFNGGSFISLSTNQETPQKFFYQGSSSVDVLDVDVLETIKKGDTAKLKR